MPNHLTITKLSGIHLVDKGAAIAAKVLIIKRADAREEAPMPQDSANQIAKAIQKALADELVKVLKAESAAGKSPQELLEIALGPIKDEATRAAILAAVAAMYQATPPKPAASPVAVEAAAKPAITEERPAAPADVVAPKPEDEMKAKKQRKDRIAELTKSMKAEERAELEKMLEAAGETDATDEVAKRTAAEKVALEKRLAVAEEEIAKARVERELTEIVAVAKASPLVPGDIKKRATILLSIRKNQGEEAYAEEVKNLKATQEMLSRGGIGKTHGTSRAPGDDGRELGEGTAHEQLTRMARELMAKRIEKGEATLKFEKAYEIVVGQHPELLVKNYEEMGFTN